MLAKKIRKITDPGTLMQSIFADLAGDVRVGESGMDLKPIGAIDSAKRVGEGTSVLVYNAGGSTAFGKFGVQTVTAPTGPSDGIPILASEKFMCNSGPDAWIIGNSASLYAYTADN